MASFIMPLYELILITKPGLARLTGQTLRSVAQIANSLGCNVRNANILGDRIMGNYRKSKDKQYFSVGRYVQVLVDANETQIVNIQKQAKNELNDVLQANFHKTKDFYQEIQENISDKQEQEQRQILFEGEVQRDLDKMIDFLSKKPH